MYYRNIIINVVEFFFFINLELINLVLYRNLIDIVYIVIYKLYIGIFYIDYFVCCLVFILIIILRIRD